ncbi:hypothetical protein BUALT_Bualt08G0140500 [Buddleja alternifolia]|uniref:Uncharacterized protein n=1 Tax=Buddleja alternifolia TaxID=168488 RepID=A0AAV6XA36_9LAMI|nr:hypothetical protein BUALT_Bualt08G0140500 [Buddleja alternifolia]
MADRTGETYEGNSFPESKEIKYFDTLSDRNYKGDGVTSMKQAIESSIGSKHGSTSLKSDISTEIGLPLSNGSFEMDTRKTRCNNVSTTENGFNTTHDSQHRTESSCSNSLSVILPVSLSNHSFQETLKEGHSFRNYTGSTDSSNSKGFEFDRRSEEPVTASSESGVSAQIARKAISNARAKNGLKISSMVGSHSSSLTKKGDKEISGNSEENIRSCDEHDNHPTSHSVERMTSSEISGESENILPGKGKLLEMNPEVPKKDEETFVAGFDLNEDINDDFIQPVVATILSHNVIHVVAKAGVSRGPPMKPLKFEGGRGWKGSAKTSAFRPTCFYKSLDKKPCIRTQSPKDAQGFTGIDLNVAAIEDEGISSPSIFQDSRSQIDSKQTKNLNFDLNCLYDAANEFTPASPPPESENAPLVDLNLNVNASIGNSSNNFHWLGQDSAIPKQDYNFARSDYLADLSTMQHLANNAHGQKYFMAAPNILQPVQPKLPFLPPHSYPYKGPFHLGTREPLPSSVHFSSTMPYARYSHEHGIFHEIMNPGACPTSIGTPHFMQVVHGQSSSNVTASTPKLDVRTEENFEHMHREAWYANATSMKRKEPEGERSEHYQLGYRQVT